MARIDGILNIMVQQRATELKLGTGRLPKLNRHGLPVRFMMPATTESTLRGLLGDLLSEEREAELEEEGRLKVDYATPKLGRFEVLFKLNRARAEDDEDGGPATGDIEGFDVLFRRQAEPLEPDEHVRGPLPGKGRSGPPPEPDASHQQASTGAPPQTSAPPAPAHRAPAHRAPARPLPDDQPPEAGDELRGLLQRAVSMNASDLHLCADELPAVRVDGSIRTLSGEPRCIPEVLLAGCLTPYARARLDAGQSADMALSVPGLGRFRVNIFRSSAGLAAALRVLRRRAPRLGELNLPEDLSDLASLPHGLVLMCGPTGSGKSSTLAAIAQEALSRRSILLLTLEDPIEFLFEGRSGASSLVRQRQIGTHVRDFATGLRDGLREDPDVILIGEMRDRETISLALTAAETGHLVLASLHSRSTVATIERIVDSYPEGRQQQIRVQLAEALRAVIGQRLVPRADGQGRVPAVEILRVNHNVRSLIREMRTAQIVSAIQSGGAEGMITLERCLSDLARRGVIHSKDARAVANDVNSLNAYQQR